MKIYVDVLILINFLYDFMILTSLSILLKRNVKIKNILIGSLIGLSTVSSIFLPLSKISLFLLKIITSISMILFTFGSRKLKENLFYFYILTIILGGCQYLISDSKVNLLLMIIISPIVLYLYILSHKRYKLKVVKYHSVVLIDKYNTYNLVGYMDTGNNLLDPITGYPIILLKKGITLLSNKIYYVPYKVVNNSSILKCFMLDKILIDGVEAKCLVGITENAFMNGVDIILNERMRKC